MDAIDRIREFAVGTGHMPTARVSHGIATSARSLEASRRSAVPVHRPEAAAKHRVDIETGEEDMARIVRPYGFVVRFDAHAAQHSKRALKLFRFADRSRPVETFENFPTLLKWLAQQHLPCSDSAPTRGK